MFKLSNYFVLREEAGSEGGEGGGGAEFTAEQFQALQAENESMKTQTQAMQGKMDELLGETKRAKAARREAEDAATQAANAKAKKDGDFEQLYNSSQEQSGAYKTELAELRNNIATERQGSAAMKLAAELAEGVNAELLSTFIAPRLKYTDEGIKILDSNGQLTVSTVEDLKADFQSNPRFLALLKGNQSSGGGASGGQKSSGAASKTITRSEFDALTPLKRMEFVKAGSKIIE
jgi:hypothetical protein